MNIIVFGAHPDDCEFHAGGTAVKWVQVGHRVKFVSVTNGDAGHMSLGREELARVRRAEMERADAILGVEGEVLDNPDGALVPDLRVREDLIRIIRRWEADVVVSHRPWGYHPDHRNTGILVSDTPFMVLVPLICPDVPPLKRNPVYLHLHDNTQIPVPFRPDIVVPVDDVFDRKVDAYDVMPSQFYEWLPWSSGILDQVPEGASERKEWLGRFMRDLTRRISPPSEGRIGGATAEMTEEFQICECGHQPSEEELREIFPFV
jgi:LmbE family N-acetylglucosaminyl deacetylase